PEPFINQAERKLGGIFDERDLVIITTANFFCPGLNQPPLDIFTIVISPGTRVVGTHALMTGATEQLVHGLISHFAEDVPQGNIDGRRRPALYTAAVKAQIATKKHLVQTFYVQRVLTQNQRGGHRVQIGFHRFCATKGFTQSRNACICFYFNPDQIWLGLQSCGFNTCNTHIFYSVEMPWVRINSAHLSCSVLMCPASTEAAPPIGRMPDWLSLLTTSGSFRASLKAVFNRS